MCVCTSVHASFRHYNLILQVQDFIDTVLCHNDIDVTVEDLRFKHADKRVPWGEEVTQKKIARLANRILIAIVAILIGGPIIAWAIATLVTITTQPKPSK